MTERTDRVVVLAADAFTRYGRHDGAGTDWGCCAWDDRCWCGYGVILDLLRGTSQYEDDTAERSTKNSGPEYVAKVEFVRNLIADLRAVLA